MDVEAPGFGSKLDNITYLFGSMLFLFLVSRSINIMCEVDVGASPE